MHKWCISWISWFDYIMHMDVVHIRSSEHSEMDAINLALKRMGFDPEEEVFENVEEAKQFAFDCDGMVGALRID